MFKKFKTIDDAFRQTRIIAILAVIASVIISVFSVYSGFRYARGAEGRVYVLTGGSAIEALMSDRKDNLPAEAKEHIRRFHQLFFTLEPDEKAISSAMERAFYLSDGSSKLLYDNLKESGFIAGIISGNVSQSLTVDSVSVELGSYPYRWKCWATEKLTRTSTVTMRNLVTTGWLRTTSRSENNAHGFLIEKLEVLDNRDLVIKNRQL